jgi:cytosine deaminase
MSVTLTRAKIPFMQGEWDIEVEGGVIVGVRQHGAASASNVVDVGGGMVTPGFVDAHLHLDKVYTFTVDDSGDKGATWTADSAQVTRSVRVLKEGFTEDDLLQRASRALAQCVRQGTAAIRAFVDVDRVVGLKAVGAALKLRQQLRRIVDIQVVAFPQEGLVSDPGNLELLYRAADMGVDVIGGIPWYEDTPDDAKRHLDLVFEVAKACHKDVHVVADDTDDPNSMNLLWLASKCVKENFVGMAAASQCRGALTTQNHAYADRTIGLVKAAGITVVENPSTSLMLSGGPAPHPNGRGVTRVLELSEAGVNVAAGQDDIQDAYYPYGRGSMVEVGFIMLHALRINSSKGLRLVYHMITHNGSKMMRLERYGLEPGCRANLCVFDQESVHQIFTETATPRYVLRDGNIIVENNSQTVFRAPIQDH